MNLLKKWWPALFPALLAAWHTAFPHIQNFVAHHPNAAVWYGILAVFVATLLKSPLVQAEISSNVVGGIGKSAGVLLLALLLPLHLDAQTPTPPVPVDIPVTHVSISASFNGYDSNGKYVASNIDNFGVAIYRNAAATQGFNVAYEHIQVPSLGQRWEMGLGSYWISLPKVPNLLFDTSNFVFTASAGAGKLLSATDGNRFAWTVSPAITYPIAGHMAWTVSYQYLRATGGISGTVNKSFQSVGTGPAIYF